MMLKAPTAPKVRVKRAAVSLIMPRSLMALSLTEYSGAMDSPHIRAVRNREGRRNSRSPAMERSFIVRSELTYTYINREGSGERDHLSPTLPNALSIHPGLNNHVTTASSRRWPPGRPPLRRPCVCAWASADRGPDPRGHVCRSPSAQRHRRRPW